MTTHWRAWAAIAAMTLSVAMWTVVSNAWLLLAVLLPALAVIIGGGSWATYRAQHQLIDRQPNAEFVSRADVSSSGLENMAGDGGSAFARERSSSTDRLGLAGYIVVDDGGVTWQPGVLARRKASPVSISWERVRSATVQPFGLRNSHGALLRLSTESGPVAFRTFRAPELVRVLQTRLRGRVEIVPGSF